ncbi:serine hydrolase family protein [Stutzerimonas urumqiensis]|uniref:RBBP9/YdeN family alpha/beta hydrolase n=1 Tax=Stutzerimonas urumqiensis TaxID=638269 RepID=UPI003BAACF5B
MSFWKSASIIAALCALVLPASASPTLRPVVYILHGYGAGPDEHWFPWLKTRLAEQGIEARVLAFPNADQPSATAWAEYLDQAVTRHDRQTYFVAHSLGVITLLRHIERLPASTTLGGMVLVSGFAERLPDLPQLDPFIPPSLDLREITDKVRQRFVLAAKDDSIVPYRLTQTLAEELGAAFELRETGGHFLGSDGFVEHPAVLGQVLRMVRAGK